MSEYLSVLLPLLDGQAAAFDGETVRAHVGLSTPRPAPAASAPPASAPSASAPSASAPPASGRPPVLLAAMRPQMLRLAGQRADGTILWMTGPATVRDYIVPAITAAAPAACPARGSSASSRCSHRRCGGGPAAAQQGLAIYGQLPSYRAMLDREGAAGPGHVAWPARGRGRGPARRAGRRRGDRLRGRRAGPGRRPERGPAPCSRSWPPPGSPRSADAELVPLRVGHRDPPQRPLLAPVQLGRAGGDQPGHRRPGLFRAGPRFQGAPGSWSSSPRGRPGRARGCGRWPGRRDARWRPRRPRRGRRDGPAFRQGWHVPRRSFS